MFLPPGDNPWVHRLCDTFFPTWAYVYGRVRNVVLAEEDADRLRGLRDARAILAPNHPTIADPIVMMWVAHHVGQRFNYLAAREILEGFKGRMLNQLGAYSVVRGTPDRESLRMTRRLLAELDRRVVIFPEGEIYEHNDTLLDFQTGVAQIGFWVLEDLLKVGKEPRLPLVPIAIKYRCAEAPRPAIENSLRDLEEALDLPAPGRLTTYLRLLRVGERVLSTLERQEGIRPPEGEALTARIQAVRRRVLERVAQAIGADAIGRDSPAEQLHLLYNALKAWVGLLPDDYSPYDERLHEQRKATAAPLFRDLHRLQNFLVVTGDYVAAQHTAERFLDVLGRLEQEVLGGVRHPVLKEAVVRIAPPLRLEDHLPAYRENKRPAVADITRQLREAIRRMLLEMAAEATPISQTD